MTAQRDEIEAHLKDVEELLAETETAERADAFHVRTWWLSAAEFNQEDAAHVAQRLGEIRTKFGLPGDP